MYEVTEYYVQPTRGGAIKFRDPALAHREAQRLGRRGGRVMVFSVRGWPRYDLWAEPALVATYGAGEEGDLRPNALERLQ